ncbi:hypothetical protein ACFLQ6_05675 [Thermoproteota archaeon]
MILRLRSKKDDTTNKKHTHRFPKVHVSILLISTLLILQCYSIIISNVSANTLSITPLNGTTTPGGTLQFQGEVTFPPGSKPLTSWQILESPPEPGITVTFIPDPANSLKWTMNVQVSPSKLHGTYSLSIWSNPQGAPFPGSDSRNVMVQITVASSAPPSLNFNFILEISPPLIEVEAGVEGNFQLNILYSDPSHMGTPINILDVTGLGPDMNWHLNPSGVLTITTMPTTPPGDYLIEVFGEANGVMRQAGATLIVGELPHEEPPHEEPPHEEPPMDEQFPEEDMPSEEYPSEDETAGTPQSNFITLSTELRENELIIVTGYLSPPIVGDEEPDVDIMYSGPRGERITHRVPVRGFDIFDDTYQPTSEGPWTITAEWRGNENWLPTESSPSTVIIEPRSANLTHLFENSLWPLVILCAILIVGILFLFSRRKP